MRVRDGVRRQGLSIQADQTIRDAAVLMEAEDVGSLVVLDGDEVGGIVTDRDLVRRAVAKSVDGSARIDAVMSLPVVTIDADDELDSAFGVFRDHAVRRLVVTEAGRFIGVLTIDDLMINLTGKLGDLVRPVTAETIFGQRDSPVPAIS